MGKILRVLSPVYDTMIYRGTPFTPKTHLILAEILVSAFTVASIAKTIVGPL